MTRQSRERTLTATRVKVCVLLVKTLVISYLAQVHPGHADLHVADGRFLRRGAVQRHGGPAVLDGGRGHAARGDGVQHPHQRLRKGEPDGTWREVLLPIRRG